MLRRCVQHTTQTPTIGRPVSPVLQHLKDLVTAWASGRAAPLPLPDGVTAAQMREVLCAHNVEVVLGPLLPDSGGDRTLTHQVDLARGRTDFLLLECERLIPVLTTESCRPVLLKGAALALAVYPQRTDRWFVDLDILVPRNEVDEACTRMEAAGYRLLQGGRDPLFYEKYHLHRMMIGPQGSVVEIHWDLTIPGSVYRHDVAGLFSRAQPHLLGQQSVLCAGTVDQILHGVYQNIADGFLDLRRVVDLVLLVRTMVPADWDYLVAQAQKTGMSRALWLTLHNMKQISGVDAPSGVMPALAPGRGAQRALRGLDVAAGCLARRAETADGYTQMLHLIMTPTARLRGREVVRALWVGEAQLLDQGHNPDRMPGMGVRLVMFARRVKYLAVGGLRVARALLTSVVSL